MNAEGGTPPITFAFEENPETGADNSSFVIADNKINVGETPLSEAKTYKVNVKATDTKGKTFVEGFDIPVIARDPEITDITANIVPNLQVGNSNVNTGATVATLTAVENFSLCL